MEYTKRSDTRYFHPLSLSDWIDKAKLANVPYVDIIHVVDFESNDLLNCEFEGIHQNRLLKAWDTIRDNSETGYMMRWDCCAPLWLKSDLSNGKYEWSSNFSTVNDILEDPRLFEILYTDWKRLLLPVFKRPWIKSLIIGGYPVEYRAFVEKGKIVGISNYYPQRILPVRTRDIQTVFDYTTKIVNTLDVHRWDPRWNDLMKSMGDKIFGREPEDVRNCTLDFIVDELENVLFLEGGPEHARGAHPCCFLGTSDTVGLAMESGVKVSENLNVFLSK